MPRFFFDVTQDGHASRDDEGEVFSDIARARLELALVLAEMARDKIKEFRPYLIAIMARDEDGARVAGASLEFRVVGAD
jgi:hypothetical protein